MKNKKLYKGTFDEIHVPNKLLGKVKEENMNKSLKKFPKIAAACIAATVVLVGSNAVTYAATGETWVAKITILVDGVEKEMDAEYHTDANGNKTVSIDVDEEGMEKVEIRSVDENTDQFTVIDKSQEFVVEGLEEEDGKIFLIAQDGEEKIKKDITEDFADGHYEGEMKSKDGTTHHIEITGTVEEHEVNVTSE